MPTWLSKYIIPTSLTWWTGVAMLASGIIMALSGLIPALAAFSGPLSAIWTGQSSAVLIAGGLTAIGLRASVSTAVATLATDAAKKAPIPTLAADVANVVTTSTAP